MKKLLDILTNNEIDEKTKTSILNKYSLLFEDNFVPDITKGGLLEDFNFDCFRPEKLNNMNEKNKWKRRQKNWKKRKKRV